MTPELQARIEKWAEDTKAHLLLSEVPANDAEDLLQRACALFFDLQVGEGSIPRSAPPQQKLPKWTWACSCGTEWTYAEKAPRYCPTCGLCDPDLVCEHGTAIDVHCCGCHSGFLFDSTKCTCLAAPALPGETQPQSLENGCATLPPHAATDRP